jgi:hypothetical protein
MALNIYVGRLEIYIMGLNQQVFCFQFISWEIIFNFQIIFFFFLTILNLQPFTYQRNQIAQKKRHLSIAISREPMNKLGNDNLMHECEQQLVKPEFNHY